MKLTDINEWVCGKCNCEPCRCDSVVEKWSSKYKKSIDCSNPKGFSQKAHCAGKKKKKTNEIEDRISESLRDWFKKEDWVRIDTQGNISGKCGTMKNKKNPSRCLPRKKAQSLTKAERKASAQKKKREGKKGKQFVKNPK